MKKLLLRMMCCCLLLPAPATYADDTDIFRVEMPDQKTNAESLGVRSMVPTRVMNRFTHDKTVYFSEYQPTANRFWYGNLKRYQWAMNNDALEIKSYKSPSGTQATWATEACKGGSNPTDYCFAHGQHNHQRARSGWNNKDKADGAIVTQGGSASLQKPLGKRHVYLQLEGDHLATLEGPVKDTDALMALPHRGSTKAQAFLRDKLLALPAQEHEQTLDYVNWLSGYDKPAVDGAEQGREFMGLDRQPQESLAPQLTLSQELSRQYYGSPLHVTPRVVDYGALSGGELGTKNVVFMSTNAGYLRAINARNGEEYFSLYPRSLIKNIPVLYANDIGPLIYGLDGEWTVWRRDANRDGVINPRHKDFVYLYAGMRRGGRHLYGIDATNLKKPKMLFDIEGGGRGAFARLGQTWSQPTLAWVKLPGIKGPVAVLIFGGGYDVNYDAVDSGSGSRMCGDKTVLCGNQVYMVLAETVGNRAAGSLVWWASNDMASHRYEKDLNHSIVAKIKTLDQDGDGYTDFFYAVDLGGQVFRFTLNHEATTLKSLVNVHTLAQLGNEGSRHKNKHISVNNRQFFSEPSIAIGSDKKGHYKAIALGSGWRSNPLDTSIDEHFFVIKDRGNNKTYTLTGIDRIASRTGVDTLENGFYHDFESRGEKTFGRAVILNNRVYFSTYIPPDLASGKKGYARVYGLDMHSGNGVFNSVGEVTAPTEHNQLYIGGLNKRVAGNLQLLLDGNRAVLLAGTTGIAEQPLPANKLQLMSWRQLAKGSAVYDLDFMKEKK